MKRTLIFATIFSSILMINSAFAQEQLALTTETMHSIPIQQQLIANESYNNSFQAVIFPRINGTISVNVQKGRHETVTVHIYNSSGILIKKDKLGYRSLITKEYLFNDLAKGTYIFKLSGSGKVYAKEVVVQ